MTNIKNLYHQNRAKENTNKFIEAIFPWIVGTALIILIGVVPTLLN